MNIKFGMNLEDEDCRVEIDVFGEEGDLVYLDVLEGDVGEPLDAGRGLVTLTFDEARRLAAALRAIVGEGA